MIDSDIVVGTGLRITVAKDELAANLATVARGVSTRATVLVLGGIQLRSEGGQLHLAATAIERDALVDTVARVGRSASRDESRPVLTGILVRFEPGRIVMAATDSYRLAVKETPVEAALPDLEAIIPARALQELARIAVGAD